MLWRDDWIYCDRRRNGSLGRLSVYGQVSLRVSLVTRGVIIWVFCKKNNILTCVLASYLELKHFFQFTNASILSPHSIGNAILSCNTNFSVFQSHFNGN